MTDLEKWLVSRIRKALTVKGNPVRTTAILMEAVQNLPHPPSAAPEAAAKAGRSSLDKEFGIAEKPDPPSKNPARPLSEHLKSHPGLEAKGLAVCSIRQPGTVYVIAEEEEPVQGCRLFALSVMKSKQKGGEGQLFHGIPEHMLVVYENEI